MAIDPAVVELCAEVGIECIEGTAYPRLGQTRAHRTIKRIIRKYGEDHTRLVLTTLAETSNNKACLDEHCIWATSDLVRKFRAEIERDATFWLEIWDRLPVGFLQSRTQEMRGWVRQRDALAAMIYERLRRVFGQPDLLEE